MARICKNGKPDKRCKPRPDLAERNRSPENIAKVKEWWTPERRQQRSIELMELWAKHGGLKKRSAKSG